MNGQHIGHIKRGVNKTYYCLVIIFDIIIIKIIIIMPQPLGFKVFKEDLGNEWVNPAINNSSFTQWEGGSYDDDYEKFSFGGKTFTLGENTYTHIFLQTNGWLQLAVETTSGDKDHSPSIAEFAGIPSIGIPWDDYHNGNIYYTPTCIDDQFIIAYETVHWGTNINVKVIVKLNMDSHPTSPGNITLELGEVGITYTSVMGVSYGGLSLNDPTINFTDFPNGIEFNYPSIPVDTITTGENAEELLRNKKITFKRVNTTDPVITVLGENPVIVEKGSTYTDAGATADGGETVTTSGTVDTDVVGTYILTYSATDGNNNTGTATRTVNVVDSTAPGIITVKFAIPNGGREIKLNFVPNNDIPNTTTTWKIDFGDGYNSNSPDPVKTYTNDTGSEIEKEIKFQITSGAMSAIQIDADSIGYLKELTVGNSTLVKNGTPYETPDLSWGLNAVFTGDPSSETGTLLDTNYNVTTLYDATTPIGFFQNATRLTTVPGHLISGITNLSNLFNGASVFNSDISGWDVSNVTDMSSMFNGASVFNQSIGNWNVSNVTDMSSMFNGASVFNQNINTKEITVENSPTGVAYTAWDTSKVENMSYIFSNALAFNQNIGNWNVSNVGNMTHMFNEAIVFNQSIGNWNVSKVTDMSYMFSTSNTLAFNQDIGNWDTSSVENMTRMFNSARSFNQNINTKQVTVNGITYTAWDTSSVTNMSYMFSETLVFNQDIGNWNVSKVTNMSYMFNNADFNQYIGNWDTSSVENMSYMFNNADFNQNISYWNVNQYKPDTTELTDLTNMFGGESVIDENNIYGFSVPTPTYDQFNQPFKPATKTDLQNALTLWYTKANNDSETAANTYQGTGNGSDYFGNPKDWDVTAVTDMSELFKNIPAISNYSVHPEIGNWDTSSVENMSSMFYGVSSFNQPIGNWNVFQVTNMSVMFYKTEAFNQNINTKEVTVNGTTYTAWNVSSVENMDAMFSRTAAFNQDIGQWNVSSVENMGAMFSRAAAFNQDISKWDTSKVTDMNYMFYDAAAFNQNINTKEITAENSPTGVAYTAWDVSEVTDTQNMFNGAAAFNQDISQWNVSKVRFMYGMFNGATDFNQNISGWKLKDGNVVLTNMFSSSGITTQTYNGTSSIGKLYGFTVPHPYYNEFNQDIMINGYNPIAIERGTTYTDAGAVTASDVTNLTTTNPVDTNVAGTYSVSYSGTKGVQTVTRTRTVEVVDTTSPEITSNLVTSIDDGETELGTVSANEPVSWSVDIDHVQVVQVDDNKGKVTLKQAADYKTKQTYTYTITATDQSSNKTTTAPITVNVKDTTAPVITVRGDNPVTVEKGSTYTDTGATADGGETVTTSGTVDTSVVGSYTLTYSATDANDNTAIEKTRTVKVVDTTAPVITVRGDNPVTVEKGSTYTDDGATADGGETVTTTGTVDTSVVGSYTLTYSATDAAGNTAIEKTRTVKVVDTTAPVITVTGDKEVTVEKGSSYTELGATTTDGTITTIGLENTDISVSSLVNENEKLIFTIPLNPDLKTLTYFCTSHSIMIGEIDLDDSTTETDKTYYVRPNTNAFISPYYIFSTTPNGSALNTSSRITLYRGKTYTFIRNTNNGHPFNIGTAYKENNTGMYIFSTGTGEAISGSVSGVDISTLGSYTITYSATDAAGNTGIATRTVNVVDTTAPVITVTGDDEITIEKGSTYTELGASTDGGEDVTPSGTVDTDVVGTYILTYSATDAAGNQAIEKTRTVNVVDTTAPVITVTGYNPATVEKGSTYTDEGATTTDGTITTSGKVDTYVVGTYILTYSATDANDNTGTAIRTVNVVDSTAPVINISSVLSTIDDGQTVLGSVSANETVTWSITGTGVSINTTGTTGTTGTAGVITLDSAADYKTATSHSFTVTATDPSNNYTTTDRITVNVVDTTAPVITVTGDNPATVEKGTTYTDAGASADGGEIVTTSGTVDTDVVGTYILTYSATDANENTGSAIRTVNVQDTTAPVITVTGDNNVTIKKGSSYTELGASADGGETVTTSGKVDTDVVGTYILTYSATDANDNTGTATRTVNVVETNVVDNNVVVELSSNVFIYNSSENATTNDKLDFTKSVFQSLYNSFNQPGKAIKVDSNEGGIILPGISEEPIMKPIFLYDGSSKTELTEEEVQDKNIYILTESGQTIKIGTTIITQNSSNYSVTINGVTTTKERGSTFVVGTETFILGSIYIEPVVINSNSCACISQSDPLNNAILDDVSASPAKDSTSDSGNSFSILRNAFRRTYYPVQPAKKEIYGDKDASVIVRQRTMNETSRTLNAVGLPMSFTNGNDSNLVRRSVQRTRNSGGVPNKVAKRGPFQ